MFSSWSLLRVTAVEASLINSVGKAVEVEVEVGVGVGETLRV